MVFLIDKLMVNSPYSYTNDVLFQLVLNRLPFVVYDYEVTQRHHVYSKLLPPPLTLGALAHLGTQVVTRERI